MTCKCAYILLPHNMYDDGKQRLAAAMRFLRQSVLLQDMMSRALGSQQNLEKLNIKKLVTKKMFLTFKIFFGCSQMKIFFSSCSLMRSNTNFQEGLANPKYTSISYQKNAFQGRPRYVSMPIFFSPIMYTITENKDQQQCSVFSEDFCHITQNIMQK